MRDRRWGLLMAAACSLALALPVRAGCPNKGGALVMDTKDHSGYYLYELIGDLSFRIFIPGKSFQLDKGRIPGHVLYIVDGAEFQLEGVRRTTFANFVRGPGEEQTLDAQVRYEQDYVRAMSPEAQITDIGIRELKSNDGRLLRTIRMWKYTMPDSTTSMYFMSTLLDADTVAMIAAHLTRSEADAMGILRRVAFSITPLTATDCAKLPID